MNPVALLRHVDNAEVTYDALAFWCPGCEHIDDQGERHGGMHLLPVNTTAHSPSWDWDGSLEAPTLTPSILSRRNFYTGPNTPPREFICHSYLREGIFEFLGDCTHALVGQHVPLPPLPDWFSP